MKANIDKFGEYEFEFTEVGGTRNERRKLMKIDAGIFFFFLFPFATYICL